MRRGISSRAAEFAHCRGILTLPQYFNISAEFEKRLVISTIFGVTVITVISLISCHLHFLTSDHFGCSVETLRFKMTDILNIRHQSLISVDSHHESRVSLHLWKKRFSFCVANIQCQSSITEVSKQLSVFIHKREAVASRRIWTILLWWAVEF